MSHRTSPQHLTVAGRRSFRGVEYICDTPNCCAVVVLLPHSTLDSTSGPISPRSTAYSITLSQPLDSTLLTFLLCIVAATAAAAAAAAAAIAATTAAAAGVQLIRVPDTKTMLRQRPGKLQESQGSRTAVPPLDSDDQKKLVAMLARDAKRQTALFERVFGAFLVVCGVALLRCWLHLLWCPEGAEPLPHRLALGDVPDAAFHLTYAGQLVGLYLAHKIAQGSQWHILAGVMVSWTSLFSWVAVFRRFGVTNPILYWMPFGPATIVGVAVYLYTSRKSLEGKVKELDGLRYNHKEL